MNKRRMDSQQVQRATKAFTELSESLAGALERASRLPSIDISKLNLLITVAMDIKEGRIINPPYNCSMYEDDLMTEDAKKHLLELHEAMGI